jgi:hypothetical protein
MCLQGVVLGSVLEGQALTSRIGLSQGICAGTILAMIFGTCNAEDTAVVHVAGLCHPETAGQRYLVCCKDQYSTLELAKVAVAAGVAGFDCGFDLAAWQRCYSEEEEEEEEGLCDLKHSSVCKLTRRSPNGRELIAPEVSVLPPNSWMRSTRPRMGARREAQIEPYGI